MFHTLARLGSSLRIPSNRASLFPSRLSRSLNSMFINQFLWKNSVQISIFHRGHATSKLVKQDFRGIDHDSKKCGQCRTMDPDDFDPGRLCCRVCLDRKRKKYSSRKSASLCGSCGSVADKGKSRCSICLEYDLNFHKKRGEKRKALNQCINCSNTAENGTCRCSECHEKNLKYQRELTKRKKALKQCLVCSDTPQDGRTRCPNCLEKARASSNKTRARKEKQGRQKLEKQ